VRVFLRGLEYLFFLVVAMSRDSIRSLCFLLPIFPAMTASISFLRAENLGEIILPTKSSESQPSSPWAKDPETKAIISDKDGNSQVDARDLLRVLDEMVASGSGENDLINFSKDWHRKPLVLTPTTQNLVGLENGRALWGDFEGDGDFDLILFPRRIVNLAPGESYVCYHYKNESANLVLNSTFSVGRAGILSEVIDFNRDGLLDVVIGAEIQVNNGVSFVGASGTGLENASLIATGDLDNDGDFDTIGSASGEWNTNVFFSQDGAFIQDASQSLPVRGSAWPGLFADFDLDGDSDFVMSVYGNGSTMEYFENDGSRLIHGHSIGGSECTLCWGDYNNDGVIDLFVSGSFGGFNVWRETGVVTNSVTDVLGWDFQSIARYWGQPALGDVDNDGDLDLGLVPGAREGIDFFLNEADVFSNSGWSDDTFHEGDDIALADYDSDGDLDFIVTGRNSGGAPQTILYSNMEADPDGHNNPNSPPLPPSSDFSSEYAEGILTLSWSAGSDEETPTLGLYYNLRVGTAPGGNDVLSGAYGTPLLGNCGTRRFAWFNIPLGELSEAYYWNVQTIDTGLAASPWSEDQVHQDTP
jgi:VCBS repeat protein